MFQGEPGPNSEIPNRPIRMLPFALAAGLTAYLMLSLAGVDATMTAIFAAIAGGWTLGRLSRRPESDG